MQGTRRSDERSGPLSSAARAALALVAAAALFLQALVLQAHAHTFSFAAPACEQLLAGARQVEALGSEHHQAGCILCEAMASNGRALLPAAAEIATSGNAAYETQALAIRRAPRVLTHTWRSRAPPILL